MKNFLKDIFDYLHMNTGDKALHFWAGAIIAALFCLVETWIIKKNGFASSLFLIRDFSLPFGAMVIVALAAAWKEIWYDGRWGFGVPSRKDFWWTMLGGLITALIIWIAVIVFNIFPQYELMTPEREWKLRMEEIHKNDPASFSDSTLILRSDSLLNKLKMESQ
jgi:hypothetical protein